MHHCMASSMATVLPSCCGAQARFAAPTVRLVHSADLDAASCELVEQCVVNSAAFPPVEVLYPVCCELEDKGQQLSMAGNQSRSCQCQ